MADQGTGAIETRAPAEARSTSVAIIGAGRVGMVFGVLLERAGHPVVAASGGPDTRSRSERYLPHARYVPSEDAAKAATMASIVILGVPDDVIASTCDRVANGGGFHRGQHVMHLSGSVSLEALASAAELGAEPLCLHPLMVFPTVDDGVKRLGGSTIGVTAASEEGFRFGERLAHDVGAAPLRISGENKPLYHAAAVFCSNYVAASVAMAEHLFRLAGLSDPGPAFAPLARAALDATLTAGAAALTGPAARGDVGTVSRNAHALAARAPGALESYVAMARVSAGIAERAGRLRPEERERLEQELARWS